LTLPAICAALCCPLPLALGVAMMLALGWISGRVAAFFETAR